MGALAVGHSHPQVVDAVRTQLHRFTIPPSAAFLMTGGYVRLAERIKSACV
ncbi:hypothetical protein X770_31705 [Mesorhizobium sp. LSJC269B00]|nr:hypothetical protein X770_31705 [Mesorhizobium sp. LSJC269B00]